MVDAEPYLYKRLGDKVASDFAQGPSSEIHLLGTRLGGLLVYEDKQRSFEDQVPIITYHSKTHSPDLAWV